MRLEQEAAAKEAEDAKDAEAPAEGEVEETPAEVEEVPAEEEAPVEAE